MLCTSSYISDGIYLWSYELLTQGEFCHSIHQYYFVHSLLIGIPRFGINEIIYIWLSRHINVCILCIFTEFINRVVIKNIKRTPSPSISPVAIKQKRPHGNIKMRIYKFVPCQGLCCRCIAVRNTTKLRYYLSLGIFEAKKCQKAK